MYRHVLLPFHPHRYADLFHAGNGCRPYPTNSEVTAMIQHIIQTEIIPFSFGNQRIHLHCVIHARTESYQTGNHQIIKSRMIVITAAFLIPFQPITGYLIQILADVGTPTMMLRLHIAFHLMEIHAVCQYSLRIIIHEIGHCSQSLCRCKRPDSPIPFTLTYAMRTELRMTALGSGKSVRCGKPFSSITSFHATSYWEEASGKLKYQGI